MAKFSIDPHSQHARAEPSGGEALSSIPPGEGRVLALGKERLAVYRNGNGQLSALSPV